MSAKYCAIALVMWFAAWFPVSQLFGSHPHFPSAFLAPFLGIVALGDRSAWDTTAKLFSEVTVPFLVFWAVALPLTGLVVIAWLRQASKAPAGLAP